MPWNEFDDNILWRPCLWKQTSRTHNSSEAALFPTWSWSSVAGPVKFEIYIYNVPVTTWAHFSPEEDNFDVLIPPKMKRYGLHQLAHTERFFDLEHWIDLRDCKCKGLNQECCEDCCLDSHTRVQMNMQRRTSTFLKKFSDEDTNAALIPGRLLLLTQTARLRLEYYGTLSGEPESPTEFSLWNEDEKWTGIIQLLEYDAELVMQMCKGGNKAFFDFAAISISYIWDGSSPLYRFLDNTQVSKYLYQAPFTREDEVKLFSESKEKFFQEMRYKGYYKPLCDRLVDELPVLNVMLLRWRGKVAQRVGLGQVWVKRWTQSNPKISPIVLG
ncbi:uncharacterized protein EAF02_005596 [Botrytis sinoallii]|uniref:uncharacterized protein n=1 Tax=Botrytis sinoallii TaxID=1463999 RepID=UPI0019011427|nr:uncharacterized protein EAF02_005596 [Botrytis sinoallii]KAF7883676.1 hypothetical protein EAF02_005596 [Botrytis sinoallii]